MAVKTPQLTLKFGASSDDIAVDGKTFHRSELPRDKQAAMRRIIIGALAQGGFFQSKDAQ